MKAKLWKVYFEDYDSLVVNAQNIQEALKKGLNYGKENRFPKYVKIDRIEYLAEED